jgi:glycosyltransferase involved in cell wall biosynthesis
LVPDLFGRHGGIARYCSLVAKALSESRTVTRLDIIALHDPIGTRPDVRYLASGSYSYLPCGGQRGRFARAAVMALGRRRYDLLLSGHVHLSPLLLAPIPSQFRSKRVTFVYGIDVWDPLPPLRRWSLAQSNTVIAISDFTARRAAGANGLQRGKVRVLHNCLDPSLECVPSSTWDNAPPLGIPTPGGNPALTVARLSKSESYKGHHTVLRAMPRVLEYVPDLRYMIVGDGDLRPELERLARQLGVEQRTHFLGAMSDAQLARAFDTCKLYVMPSKYEGFGFAFLEAMAHGLPIIAGNRDAAREVIGDEAGVLVDPDDAEQVAVAMVRLLSDDYLREQLGKSGRDRVGRLFRYERFRTRLIAHLLTDNEAPA